MRPILTAAAALILLPPWLYAESPLILQIRVAEGEGAQYTIGGRAVRGITIEVTDEAGQPVANTAVSFRLPEDGPSGLFPNGTRTEIASTSPEGRAAVWGMKWNRIAGPFAVRITAAKGETRAGAIVSQALVETSAITASATGKTDSINSYKIRRGKRWLWLAALAAGAAGGGLALGARSGGIPATPGAAAASLSIGSPSIILGGGGK